MHLVDLCSVFSLLFNAVFKLFVFSNETGANVSNIEVWKCACQSQSENIPLQNVPNGNGNSFSFEKI